MTTADTAQAAHVDKGIFRDVIGRFASGVTVITSRLDEQDYGTTASAVSSLSMEPPMLLICLNRTSETREAILAAGWFAVNILSEGQADLAYAFAKKSPDRFKGTKTTRGTSGLPLLTGALAQLECRVSETATGGTHTVFLGEVLNAAGTDANPLTYYRGRFGRFEDMRQEEAYRRLRQLVVSREIPPGESLDVDKLASQLDLDQTHVFYALTRLTGDGLVQREADGRLEIKPLDVRAAHEAIDARCAIEVAVVDKVAGQIGDDDAAALRTHATDANDATTTKPADIEKLVRSGHAFHQHFIGLLGNEALQSFFRRLDINAIWMRAAPDIDRRGNTSAVYLGELVEACVAGDRELAKRILYDHAARVKANAQEAIELGGGEV
jgi:flavin reductase (DIM6/NTAB) family NADH-FMN oxidoreductase RutF